MKPRFEPRDERFEALLKGAQELEERMQKAVPMYSQKEGSEIGPSHFVTETGGQTRTAHYWTNGIVPESTDIANKGATVESSNILDTPGAHYPTSESTLGSHQIGGDERPPALNKNLGVVNDEQWRLGIIAKSIESLSRRV